MNWKFWKKQEKQYKRPKYYPTFYMEYHHTIGGNYGSIAPHKVNYCCKKMKNQIKDISKNDWGDAFNYFSVYPKDIYLKFKVGVYNWKFFIFRNVKLKFSNYAIIHYCPFCGAKIDLKCVGVKEYKKVSCEEVIEPAKTRKVCKYEWQEVE